jgi:hypothetical protein
MIGAKSGLVEFSMSYMAIVKSQNIFVVFNWCMDFYFRFENRAKKSDSNKFFKLHTIPLAREKGVLKLVRL